MAALNEIKERIVSVRSTLKITSAMKLIAASKLHKAQLALEAVRPYEMAMKEMLNAVMRHFEQKGDTATESSSVPGFSLDGRNGSSSSAPVAVIVVSSNNSLCGAYNSNVIRKCLDFCSELPSVQFFPIGRKAVDALKRAGLASQGDFKDLIGKVDKAKSEAFAEMLRSRYLSGEFSKVVLVYTHYISPAHQTPVVEQYLPYVPEANGQEEEGGSVEDYIFEPTPKDLVERIIPRLLAIKFHEALLDSSAAEHAARTIAMQTATDNAEQLLSELSLEYNKSRQEKITTEILTLESAMG